MIPSSRLLDLIALKSNCIQGITDTMPKLTGADIAQHNSKDSCWVIVHGKAYDVTEFLPGEDPSPARENG